MKLKRVALALSFLCWFAATLPGRAGITPEQRKFFETKIRPILATECYECHEVGAKKVGAKLLLDSAAGLMKDGESRYC
jgi:cytochrome c553